MRRRHRRNVAAHFIKIGSLTDLKASYATNHRRMIGRCVSLSLLAFVELLHHRQIVYTRGVLRYSKMHSIALELNMVLSTYYWLGLKVNVLISVFCIKFRSVVII